MASEIRSPVGLSRLKTITSGAVSQDAAFTFDATANMADYGAFLGRGLDALQITSPIVSTGGADLEIQAGSSTYYLAGGGNVQTIPGPITSVRIVAKNAAIGGTGADQIRITPLSRLKTGRL